VEARTQLLSQKAALLDRVLRRDMVQNAVHLTHPAAAGINDPRANAYGIAANVDASPLRSLPA
jgi:hypothetical protein